MRIRYKLEKEDYHEFSEYGLENMKSMKRQINIQRLVMLGVFTVIAVFFVMAKGVSFKKVLPIYAAGAILWMVAYPRFLSRSIEKRLDKSFEENDRLLEEKVVEVKEDGFYLITEEEDLLVTKEFYNVINAENSIYLYLDPDSAYIIPKRCFDGVEEIREFLKLVREMSLN